MSNSAITTDSLNPAPASIARADVDAGWIDFSDIAEPDAPMLRPAHPGVILREEWLEPLGLSVYALAKALKVERSRINDIVLGRRGISADTALRLARYFGTDAQSWLTLQAKYDLSAARADAGVRIEAEITPRAA